MTLGLPEFSRFMLSLSFSHQELAVSLERSQCDSPSEKSARQGEGRPESRPSSALHPMCHLGQLRDLSEPLLNESVTGLGEASQGR